MNSKILVTLVFIVLGISSVTLALDFGNVRTMFYKGKYAEIISFTPFEGTGRPSSSPSWFDVEKFEVKKTVVNGFLYHSKDGSFRQRIYLSMVGKLDVGGSEKTTQFKFWSDPNSNTECQEFNDQKILCESDGGTLKIYRSDYRWVGHVNKYTVEVEDQVVGFKYLTLTGYDGDTELFKIKVVEDFFKFSYYYVPKTRAVSQLDNGNVDYLNPPEDANPNIPFEMSNFTQIKNWGGGKIIKGGGYQGSVQFVSEGTLDTTGGTIPLRVDISTYLVEKSFSDCPVFNSTDLFCKIRFGYIHVYRPAHEDRTLWKTFFNLMILNITQGKATISAGVNDATDLFQISGMDVSKLEMK